MRSGSGRKLTRGLLGGRRRSGNRWCGLFLWPQLQLLDQPRHAQALNEDRKSDDREGGEDDGVALGNGRGDRERQSERERAAQATPEQGVLVGGRQAPPRPAEKLGQRINRQSASRQ